MDISPDRILQVVLGDLPEDQRRSCVVYLDERLVPAGAGISVNGGEVRVPWPAVMLFVDLEPTVNWGHACRYVLLGAEPGEVQAVGARFPPFLQGMPETMHILWKGEDVPDWAVASH